MTGVAAVVVAAGRGTRAGGDRPKQFRAVGGEAVLRRVLVALARHPQVGRVQPVIHAEDESRYREVVGRLPVPDPVFGGATRQASVLAGLEALAPHRPDIVLVHDAARPFVSPALIARAISAAQTSGAAVPVLPVSDTVKRVDSAGRIEETLDRSVLRLLQTPQAFAFAPLLAAHRRAAAEARDDFTDDATLAEWAGMTVSTFEGEAGNFKITSAEDFARADALHFAALGDVRTGSGYDVHAFGPGDHVTLGGLRIAHTQGLTGHSDADVALHALTDAILGALADGDIGSHFPPGDPQWRGASSDRFLAFAAGRVKSRGGCIAHLDVTIVCEAPRIGPHRDTMRERIAVVAGLDPARVAVKATTSEGLGFTGRGEGIAASAVATIRLPWN